MSTFSNFNFCTFLSLWFNFFSSTAYATCSERAYSFTCSFIYDYSSCNYLLWFSYTCLIMLSLVASSFFCNIIFYCSSWSFSNFILCITEVTIWTIFFMISFLECCIWLNGNIFYDIYILNVSTLFRTSEWCFVNDLLSKHAFKFSDIWIWQYKGKYFR